MVKLPLAIILTDVFAAEASIYAVGSKSINAQHDGQPCTKLPSPSVGAKFSIGFKPEGWTWFPIGTDPVHENIAIAAFIKANKMLPVATTYENLSKKQWEYFRGLLWNDDPSGLLFDDVTDDNRNFSDGVDFGKAFKLGSPGTMTQRSHFGDLQCLHGMAAKHGEAPETTRFNILVWMEAMYKLACGNQDVKAESTLRSALPAYFSSSTQPSGDTTLKQLLMGQRASFKLPNIQFRAIGVCLHMIQDSYAVGHTHRCLKNPQDLDGRDNEGLYRPTSFSRYHETCNFADPASSNTAGFLRFKPGTYGRWGAVQAFHSYAGQDSSRHKHYDELEGTPSLVPRQLDSFNNVVGARDAIDQSATLLGFYAKKTRWEDGVRAWLEGEVFALAPNARPADGEVDEPTGRPCAAGRLSMSDGGAAPSYDAGLRRKLALVDGERGYDLESSLGTLAWTGHRGRRPLLRRVLMVFLVILALIAGVVASAVLSRVLAVFVRSLA